MASAARAAVAAPAAPGGTPPTKKTTPYWLGGGGICAVAIGLIVYFGGYSLGYFGGRPYFDVPNVDGLAAKAAIAKLKADGLNPVTKKVQGNLDNAGKVVAQDPTSPGQVRKGEQVTLSVARPPAPIPIPDVTNLNVIDAQAVLGSKGFHVRVEYVPPRTAGLTAGEVVDEQPGSPGSAQPGSTIILSVIRGTFMITVPSFSGLTQAQADTALNTAGLTVGSPTTQYSSTAAQGLVISSSPASGQKVVEGTAVHLVISSGTLVVVPDVTNELLEQAELDLRNVGLGSFTATVPASSPSEIGFVLKQHPAAGQPVRPGFPVILYVAVGSPTTSTSTTTSSTSTTTSLPSATGT
jgi:serine/threonine-protein kinase